MFDVGKIFTVGGAENYDDGPGSARSYIIDINNGNSVSVIRSGNMNKPRTLGNSVVLPSGEVVVIGGMPQTKLFSDLNAEMTAEIWSPKTGRFTELASMAVPRTYHSIALLLKDGRVVTGGGGLCGGCGVNHRDAEILTPPYLINDDGSLKTRPVINRVWATTVKNGSTLRVRMNTSGSHTFAIVRNGAVTHSVNNDARRIPLSVTRKNNKNFFLKIPSNSGVALPGHYYLFAMDSAGVPSIAEMISVEIA